METIPEEIKQFILNNIDSIAEWECVLLLHANPEKEWDVEAVAKSLYIDRQEGAKLLARLGGRHIVTVMETEASTIYRYAAQSPETDRIIRHAAELYRRHLIPLTNLIHSKHKTRIQEFADAFKIRKD